MTKATAYSKADLKNARTGGGFALISQLMFANKMLFALIIAAATEDYDYSENDDPGAVVVEKMAQAVVVHKMYVPPKVFRAFVRSSTYYAFRGICDTRMIRGKKIITIEEHKK